MPMWYPLSALLSHDLGAFVTPTILRMLLAPGAFIIIGLFAWLQNTMKKD